MLAVLGLRRISMFLKEYQLLQSPAAARAAVSSLCCSDVKAPRPSRRDPCSGGLCPFLPARRSDGQFAKQMSSCSAAGEAGWAWVLLLLPHLLSQSCGMEGWRVLFRDGMAGTSVSHTETPVLDGWCGWHCSWRAAEKKSLKSLFLCKQLEPSAWEQLKYPQSWRGETNPLTERFWLRCFNSSVVTSVWLPFSLLFLRGFFLSEAFKAAFCDVFSFSIDSSESVKQRSDVFYLQPERSCVPNSPMWYSTLPIDPGTLDIMLTRILMVREVHEELAKVKSEDSDIELSD